MYFFLSLSLSCLLGAKARTLTTCPASPALDLSASTPSLSALDSESERDWRWRTSDAIYEDDDEDKSGADENAPPSPLQLIAEAQKR